MFKIEKLYGLVLRLYKLLTGRLTRKTLGENLIGRVVRQYKLIERLGGGGQAVVYKATKVGGLARTDVDKYKAIKFFFKSPTDKDVDFNERFLREMETIYNLRSCPNIVRVSFYDITEDGFPYIMMDFYEGGTLADLAKKHSRIPLPDLLAVLKDVAAALDAAHKEGVVHRDIKPSNILFEKSGRAAVLADFGISKNKIHSTLTPPNSIVGTLAFTAPEVLDGKPADERSDFYSLGILTYYLLEGQHTMPDTSSLSEVVGWHKSSKKMLCDLQNDISREVAAVVNRMIDPEPGNRYTSAGEFVNELEAAARATSPSYVSAQTILLPTVTDGIASEENSPDTYAGLHRKYSWWDGLKSRFSGWLVVGIAAVVVALVGGILLLSGGDEDKKPKPTDVAAAPTSASAFSLSTASATESPTDTPQPTATMTETKVPTASATDTEQPTATATETESPTASATDTVRPSATATATVTASATSTTRPSTTATATFTASFTATLTATATATLPPSATFTELPSLTPTLNVPLPLTAFDTGLQASPLITNGQYQKCQGCSMPSDPTLYLNPRLENEPIVGVTWFNARDFCGKYGGRLPTDSEWVKLQKSGLLRSGTLLEWVTPDNFAGDASSQSEMLVRGANVPATPARANLADENWGFRCIFEG